MKKKELIEGVKDEFGINLFFYDGISNANNMCNSHNVFLNQAIDNQKIIEVLCNKIHKIESEYRGKNITKKEVKSKLNNITKEIVA